MLNVIQFKIVINCNFQFQAENLEENEDGTPVQDFDLHQTCRLYFPARFSNSDYDRSRDVKYQSQIIGYGYKPSSMRKADYEKKIAKPDTDKDKIKLLSNGKYIGHFQGKFPSSVKDENSRPFSNIDFLNFYFPSDFDKFVPIWVIAKCMAKGKMRMLSGETEEVFDVDSELVREAAHAVETYFKKDDRMLETIATVFNETKKRRVTASVKMAVQKAKQMETAAQLKNLNNLALNLTGKK